MSIYFLVLSLFLIVMVLRSIGKANVSKCYHKVDQAYHSLQQMQDRRFATVDQFSKLWKSEQSIDNEVFEEVKQLSVRLKDHTLTKPQKNALHSKMDTLFGAAKLLMMKKKSSLNERQLQFLLASVNEVEEQLSAASRSYHAAVAAYNQSLDSGFNNLLGGTSGYAPVDLYEARTHEILELTDLPTPESVEREDDDNYLKA